MDKNLSSTEIVMTTLPKASDEVMDLAQAKTRIDAFEAALLKSRQRQMEMGNQVVMLGAQRREMQAAQSKLWAKYRKLGAAYGQLKAQVETPIDMVLHCPSCHKQHIDAPSDSWDNPEHRSHLCRGCGTVWRPADVATNGVQAVKTKGKADRICAPKSLGNKPYPPMADVHY